MNLGQAHSRRRRGRFAAGLVAVLMLAGLVSVLEVDSASASSTSTRGLGYRITRTHYADGGFVGRYNTGTLRGYRIQPRQSAAQSSYRSPVKVANLGGASKAPTAAATARAAWILSEYGKTKDKTTAAAVDVATYALLKGGKWKVGRRYTVRRTNRTGHGATVRKYATTLIKQSAGHAGPYRATVTATTVAAGNQTAVHYKIVNAAGHAPTLSGWAGLPVTFRYPGQSAQVVTTNSAGVATAYFNAAAGATTITAGARAPESHLLVAKPYKRSASALALAGRTYVASASTTGLGVTSQTVSEKNSSTSSWTGRPLAGSYTVAGGTGTRTVDFAVYGPFSSTTVSCSGTAAWTGASTISADGTYALPSSWSPSKSGYYVWSVAVLANSTSTAASTCGAAYAARHATTTTQKRAGTATSVALGAKLGPDVTVSGFDRSEAHSLATRVYGPFIDKSRVTCSNSKKLLKTVTRSISGNGSFAQRTTITGTANVGWYVFQSTLGYGPLIGGSTSSCGVVMQVTK